MGKWRVLVVRRLALWRGRKCPRPPGRGRYYLRVRLLNLEFELTSLQGKGISCTACANLLTGGSISHGPCIRWSYPSMKKKSSTGSSGDQSHLAALESEYLHEHLPVLEHCARTKYDDGDPRLTGWITIKTIGAAWVIQVKDPDSGLSFTVTDASFDKALDTVTLLLSAEEAPWAPDPFLKSQQASKKKK